MISLGELGVYSMASIVSTAAGALMAGQLLFDPAQTWVPLAVLVVLMIFAIRTTIKVVRLLDRVNGEIAIAKTEREAARKSLKKLAKAQGVELDEDEP